MKLFSDKVEYRFRQPLSNLQLSKANLYISQYLVYSGLTLIANYGDRFEFRSGFFSGTQTALFRFDRGVMFIDSERLELHFHNKSLGFIVFVIAMTVILATHLVILPILISFVVIRIHKLLAKSFAQEALSDLGKRLDWTTDLKQ